MHDWLFLRDKSTFFRQINVFYTAEELVSRKFLSVMAFYCFKRDHAQKIFR